MKQVITEAALLVWGYTTLFTVSYVAVFNLSTPLEAIVLMVFMTSGLYLLQPSTRGFSFEKSPEEEDLDEPKPLGFTNGKESK